MFLYNNYGDGSSHRTFAQKSPDLENGKITTMTMMNEMNSEFTKRLDLLKIDPDQPFDMYYKYKYIEPNNIDKFGSIITTIEKVFTQQHNKFTHFWNNYKKFQQKISVLLCIE